MGSYPVKENFSTIPSCIIMELKDISTFTQTFRVKFYTPYNKNTKYYLRMEI